MKKYPLIAVGAAAGAVVGLFTGNIPPLPEDYARKEAPVASSVRSALASEDRVDMESAQTLMSTVDGLLGDHRALEAWMLVTGALQKSDLIELEKKAALDYLRPERRSLLSAIFARTYLQGVSEDKVLLTDPESIIAELEATVPDSIRAVELRKGLVGKLALVAPERAMRFVMDEAGPLEQADMLSEVVRSLKTRSGDWATLFVNLSGSYNPQNRARMAWPAGFSAKDLADLAGAWRKAEGIQDKEWDMLKSLTVPGETRRVETAEVIAKTQSAREALEAAKNMSATIPAHMLHDWFSVHCGEDPARVRQAMLESGKDPKIEGAAINALYRLPGGLDEIQSLLTGGKLSPQTEPAALKLLLKDAEAADLPAKVEEYTARWPELKDGAYAYLAEHSDTPGDLHSAIEQIADEDVKKNAMIRGVRNIISTDGPAGMEAVLGWRNSLPEESVSDLARDAFSTWMHREPYAASEWFADQKGLDGELKSNLLDVLISRTLGYDPEAALEWILTIEEPNMKQRWLDTYEKSLANDP